MMDGYQCDYNRSIRAFARRGVGSWCTTITPSRTENSFFSAKTFIFIITIVVVVLPSLLTYFWCCMYTLLHTLHCTHSACLPVIYTLLQVGNCVYFYLVHYTSNGASNRANLMQEEVELPKKCSYCWCSSDRSGMGIRAAVSDWGTSLERTSIPQSTLCLLPIEKVKPLRNHILYLQGRTTEHSSTPRRLLHTTVLVIVGGKPARVGILVGIAEIPGEHRIAGTFINPVEIVTSSANTSRSYDPLLTSSRAAFYS